jgi:pimeloyl-ACP methyl ester carboxylesterase
MRLLPTLTCALLACVGLLASGLSAPAAAAASPAHCSEIDLPVSVPTPRETMHGQLCTPVGRAPSTVQLLVHGATYSHLYWDFPYQPERYSYQRDMARYGHATLAVDRLGTGQSSKPPSVTLLDSVEAASIHQMVGHLRAGRVGGMRFDRIILVGHSLGAGVATIEAATYHDVDGVILTDTSHLVSALAAVNGPTVYTHPVILDPQLRHRGSDPGYVTTRPGFRPVFYEASDADPQVIATDDATKDQLSLIGFGLVLTFGDEGPASLRIDVPVLLGVGEKDFAFCGFLSRDCSSAEAFRKQEAPYFAPAAKLSTFVLPGAGHSIALHRNAGEYRDATRAWLRARFGGASESRDVSRVETR